MSRRGETFIPKNDPCYPGTACYSGDRLKIRTPAGMTEVETLPSGGFWMTLKGREVFIEVFDMKTDPSTIYKGEMR